MSIEILKKQLNDNAVGGVYIFTGAEDYLKKFYIEKIKSALNITENDPFNYLSITAEALSETALNDFLMNGPVFADKKLLYVTSFDCDDVSKISAAGALNIFKEIKNAFPDWCVIIVNQQQTDSPVSKSFAKELASALPFALNVDMPLRTASELTAWIMRHAKAENVKISRETAEYLLSVTDNSMYNLSNEMRKLFSASDRVDKATVDSLVIKTVDAKIFDFTDALIAGNAKKAMTLLDELYIHEEDTVIMGSIYASFARIYIVLLLMQKGLDKNAIAKETGYKPFAVGKTMESAKKISMNKLKKIIHLCAETDDAMKGFTKDKKQAMDYLVLSIITILGN